MQKDCKIVLFEVGGLAREQYDNITKQLAHIIKKMSQLDERVAADFAKVGEALDEITVLLQKLKDESLTETGQATLTEMETKINALADIVPNPEPPPVP